MHPSAFRLAHRLSDWPNCQLELNCCWGTTVMPVRPGSSGAIIEAFRTTAITDHSVEFALLGLQCRSRGTIWPSSQPYLLSRLKTSTRDPPDDRPSGGGQRWTPGEGSKAASVDLSIVSIVHPIYAMRKPHVFGALILLRYFFELCNAACERNLCHLTRWRNSP
jgi:hypothetical protein